MCVGAAAKLIAAIFDPDKGPSVIVTLTTSSLPKPHRNTVCKRPNDDDILAPLRSGPKVCAALPRQFLPFAVQMAGLLQVP